MLTLCHRLSGGWLRAIEDRFEGASEIRGSPEERGRSLRFATHDLFRLATAEINCAPASRLIELLSKKGIIGQPDVLEQVKRIHHDIRDSRPN